MAANMEDQPVRKTTVIKPGEIRGRVGKSARRPDVIGVPTSNTTTTECCVEIYDDFAVVKCRATRFSDWAGTMGFCVVATRVGDAWYVNPKLTAMWHPETPDLIQECGVEDLVNRSVQAMLNRELKRGDNHGA